MMNDRTGCALQMVAMASLVIVVLSSLVQCAKKAVGGAGGRPLVSPYIASLTLLLTVGMMVWYMRRK